MGWKDFFKGLGKGAIKVASFVPIPGLKPHVQARALSLIRAGVAVAEAEGGKDKAVAAVETILPVLKDAGIDLPVKKIKLLVELLLDSDVGGDLAFDETRAANIAKALGPNDIRRIAEKIDASMEARG